MARRKTPTRRRATTRKRAKAQTAAKAPAGEATPTHAPTVPDIFALSRKLGAATQEEVLSLLGSRPDAELIARGDGVATPRVTLSAFRILGVAESFFSQAPEEIRAAVNLDPDVVRIATWAAVQGVRLNARVKSTSAPTRAFLAAERAEADAVIKQARAERDKLATQVKAVGRSVATDAAVAAALAPAVLGEPDMGVHTSITLLVAEGRRLLTLDDAGTRSRVGHFRLTLEGLDRLDPVIRQARSAEEIRGGLRAVVTQRTVDRWVGITLGLLDMVVGAFQGAHRTHPKVPAVELGSLGPRRKPAAPLPSAPPSPSSLPN